MKTPLQDIYEIVGSNAKCSFDPERSEQGIDFVEVYPERTFKGGNRSKSGISVPVPPRKAPEIANKAGPPPDALTMKNDINFERAFKNRFLDSVNLLLYWVLLPVRE
ncbi:hypothetical protein [Sporosarcina sp. NPDC096371]|uniref:hypothetical protein n=1 Tax=Sporosarcina sp. NPDC096371 TaxID=3364530 RepID=UPI00382493EA